MEWYFLIPLLFALGLILMMAAVGVLVVWLAVVVICRPQRPYDPECTRCGTRASVARVSGCPRGVGPCPMA